MEFKIDFGNALTDKANTKEQVWFASVPGIVMSLGTDECVFRVGSSGDCHVMTTDIFEALSVCQSFKSLDEHAQAVANQVPSLRGRSEVARRALDDLFRRGLLIDSTHYLEQLKQTREASQAPMGRVWIRANDQPQQLQNLLQGLCDNERRYQNSQTYVVVDDVVDPSTASANSQHLAQFSKEREGYVSHLTLQARKKIIDQMAKALPHAQEAVHYLLAPEQVRAGARGAASNLIALLSARHRFVRLDARHRFPVHSMPNASDGLNISGTSDFSVRFFDNLDSAYGSGAALTTDPLALHARWCGDRLGHLLSANTVFSLERDNLKRIVPAARHKLDANTRIIATTVGFRGVPSRRNIESLFLIDAQNRADFWRDKNAYLRHLEEQNLSAGVVRSCLLEQGQMSPVMLDASGLLPPVMPHHDDEDVLFGLLCRAVSPKSVVLQTNMTLGLDRSGSQKRSTITYKPLTPSLAEFMADYLSSRLDDVRAEDAASRLHSVAAVLLDLVRAPKHERKDLLTEYLCFKRSSLIERLQRVFAEAEQAPVYWQADVRELISVNGRALTSNAPPRLRDWAENSSDEQCVDAMTQQLGAFARSLESWSEIWNYASEHGDRLLKSIVD
jgi:hypothetical protein